jgi:hypothetical protein
VCSQGWTEFEGEMVTARTQIKEERTRAPASSSDAEKEYWQRWAKNQIKRTQLSRDLFDDSQLPEAKQLKKTLSDITTDLVEFDGYAGKENRKKMSEILDRAYDRGSLLHRTICSGKFVK